MKIENLSSEEVKREQFRSLLLNLANPNIKLSDKSQRVIYYKELEEIYHQNGENDFRHFYSDIFAVLTSIYEDPTRGDINILGENIGILRKEYQAINTDQNNQLIDISSSLMKLYDHVSLDIARISYSVAGNRDILSQDSLEEIRTQINIQEAELKKIKNNTNKAEEKINNAQKEYIAIFRNLFCSCPSVYWRHDLFNIRFRKYA